MSHRLIIQAGRSERQYWRDLWRYRELFYFLAWRDILVRYKQTAVGVAWSFLRPVLTMAVLTLMMRVNGLPGDSKSPLALFVFCGVLPWQFFSTALSESGTSLVTNSNLISKIYFQYRVRLDGYWLLFTYGGNNTYQQKNADKYEQSHTDHGCQQNFKKLFHGFDLFTDVDGCPAS